MTPRDQWGENQFLGRLLNKNKRQTKPSDYDRSNSDERSNRRTPSESPLNPSNTIFPEIISNSNQPITIKRLNKTEKPNESGNAQMKLPILNEKNETVQDNRRSGVSIRRINNSTKFDEENNEVNNKREINEEIIPPRSRSTPTVKTDPINVKKISRNQIDFIQRDRTSNLDRNSQNKSRQPSVIVKSIQRHRSFSQRSTKISNQ